MQPIIGVDEVGRGSWAGPLLVVAVKYCNYVDGLKDSKKLSATKRQKLSEQITSTNQVGYGWLSSDEIDDYGLALAMYIAFAKALNELNYLNIPIITDGNINYYPLLKNSKAIIKADNTEPAVSAASIVAKVARDYRMLEYAKKYTGYDFENNVGYGTFKHKLAIKTLGYTKIHRRSFKI